MRILVTEPVHENSQNIKLTSQQPNGSPLAASNPADTMTKSGENAEAAREGGSI